MTDGCRRKETMNNTPNENGGSRSVDHIVRPTLEQFQAWTKCSRSRNGYIVECRKGLWAVESNKLENAIREGQRYFMQYAQDGEYIGLPNAEDDRRLPEEGVNRGVK